MLTFSHKDGFVAVRSTEKRKIRHGEEVHSEYFVKEENFKEEGYEEE